MAPSRQREMAARAAIATSGDSGFSELIFRVDDTKYKVGECIRSSRKQCGSFHHRLLVYPMGKVKKGLDVFLERVSTDGEDSKEPSVHIAFEISVINQREEKKTITWFDLKSFGKNEDSGWRNLLGGVKTSDRGAFVDEEGNIVIRARVYLINQKFVEQYRRFALMPAQRLVVGTGGCEEVKIEGVSDFEKGEVIRLKPIWMNNYRIQVAAYPAGHSGHPDSREALAVYVHVLARKDAEAQRPLKLKLTVVNHKRLTDSMRWVGTLSLTDAGDDNWGPNRLMSVREMRDEHLGWLDENGALVLRLSATPADEGRDPLSLTNQQGLPLPSKPTKRTLVGSREASEASPKKMKSDS
ncbi:hypothetical protein FOZ62_022363 [Perkinsus olseni]|uniref:Uncharacterized protein n=1 Tax=Perkinsus olseni TaxID=32597 RepID=A0A7J6QQ66_PEROL|nr:hypothetical protein FOZ62_022363 [Perkinsus olseni]